MSCGVQLEVRYLITILNVGVGQCSKEGVHIIGHTDVNLDEESRCIVISTYPGSILFACLNAEYFIVFAW